MSKLLWTQRQDIGPAARFNHAMAFDQVRQRVLLFGGEGGQQFKDTWERDGTRWTARQDIGVSARFGHAMVSRIRIGPAKAGPHVPSKAH